MARAETGFSPDDRTIMERRSYGWCELCDRRPAAHAHHRKPRRMGGRFGASFDDVNRPSNGLMFCASCHQWAETGNRSAARDSGIILTEAQAPDATPIHLPRYRGWVLFDDDGGVYWHPTHAAAVAAGNTTEADE